MLKDAMQKNRSNRETSNKEKQSEVPCERGVSDRTYDLPPHASGEAAMPLPEDIPSEGKQQGQAKKGAGRMPWH